MPKYPGISPYDNEKGTLGTAKKRWEKIYVKNIESDTIDGINETVDNLATTATNSVANAVAAKNAAVEAKTAAETAANNAATTAAGIQSLSETGVDNTLSIAGQAADSKKTGDWLRSIATPAENTPESNEFLQYVEDKDHRLLFGIKKDGTVDWQKGVPKVIDEKIESAVKNIDATIESNEYVQLTQDSGGKIIEGLLNDGTKIIFTPVVFQGKVSVRNEDSLNKLRYDQEVFLKKKVSIIGDSISSYAGYSPSSYYPKSDYDINDVNQMWWMQVINHFGMRFLKNISISSSTVTGDSTINEYRGSDTPGCSDYRITELADQGVTPDIVLVHIGVNDTTKEGLTISTINPNDAIVAEGTILDFAKAYDLMLYKIKTTYPDAVVYCGSMPYYIKDGYVFPRVVGNGISRTLQNRAIREACDHIGAHYVDFYSSKINGQTRSNSDIHLTKTGMNMLARCFIKKIESTY